MPTQTTNTGFESAHTDDRLVRWWIKDWRLALIFFGLAGVTAGLYFASRPNFPSPLITSFADLLDPQSWWAIQPDFSQYTKKLWFGLAFTLVGTLFLALLTWMTRSSRKESAEGTGAVMLRNFRLEPAEKGDSAFTNYFILFLLMGLSNALLYFYYRRILLGGFDRQAGSPLDNQLFTGTYTLATLTLGLGILISFGGLIRLLIEDFARPARRFLGRYLRYFYPGLISILIVLFVFTQMGQFDTLFIELVARPWNFLIFALLLYPVSIIQIWFTPLYLAFTNAQFANREDAWMMLRKIIGDEHTVWRRLRLYFWLFLHKRVYYELDTTPVRVSTDPQDRMPNEFMLRRMNRSVVRPSIPFRRFRAMLGLLYIFSLILVSASTYYGNQLSPSSGRYAVLALSTAAFGYYLIGLWRLQRTRNRQPSVRRLFDVRSWRGERPAFGYYLRDRPKRELANDRYRITEVYKEVKLAGGGLRFLFYFFTVAIVLAVIFFWITFYHALAGAEWHRSFSWFIRFLVASIFGFAGLALFRSFYGEFTFSHDPANERYGWNWLMDRLDGLTVQIMLIYNPVVAVLMLIFFGWSLVDGALMSSGFVQWLNPLNVYLLLINGLIALFIMLDRYLMLREHVRQYRRLSQGQPLSRYRISIQAQFWAWVVVLLALGGAYLGNNYHEITYRQPQGQALELQGYTKYFLADSSQSDQPILLIGADGGGLKACYWTMRCLQEIDRRGAFDGNVFALSGASGGTIGLSMYNYLKAKDASPEQIDTVIRKIGKTNFLSGDFTGLLTRFPINYLPNLPDLQPRLWEDRMEAMARAYFRIVHETLSPELSATGTDSIYDTLQSLPFWSVWAGSQVERLPLFIANSARSEDGLLGTVSPLKLDVQDRTGRRLTKLSGSIDLTFNKDGNVISYPDATFLSNRFPLASPAARINGKGQFLDAGSADNSGLNSIYSLLRYMRAQSVDSDSATAQVFTRFFDREIIVLSIRNAPSRFVRDAFLGELDSMNRYPYIGDLSANLSVALNTGLTGVPIAWDDYLFTSLPQELGLLDHYYTLDLPFVLKEGDVFSALSGELALTDLDERRQRINQSIISILPSDQKFAVMPPLGRLLSESSLDYMDLMIRYPHNESVFEFIQAASEDSVQTYANPPIIEYQ